MQEVATVVKASAQKNTVSATLMGGDVDLFANVLTVKMINKLRDR